MKPGCWIEYFENGSRISEAPPSNEISAGSHQFMGHPCMQEWDNIESIKEKVANLEEGRWMAGNILLIST